MDLKVIIYLTLILTCLDNAECDTLCPDNWVAFDGSCVYFAYGNHFNFTEAQTYCQQRGSYLVEIDTEDEMIIIKKYLTELQSHRWWIGLSDLDTEGEFRWASTNQIPEYTYWYTGEPNPSNEREEDCVMIVSSMSYKWTDVPCVDNGYPICEFRASDKLDSIVG